MKIIFENSKLYIKENKSDLTFTIKEKDKKDNITYDLVNTITYLRLNYPEEKEIIQKLTDKYIEYEKESDNKLNRILSIFGIEK